tara:strand:+ start:1063 stop:1614 length:552 start_codon:yes stop_codon:yes gene_type:complete
MNDLVKQMQKDAETIPEDNMGKIGAVATDIAEIENEIQKLKEELKKKEDYKTKLSEEVLPSLFSEVGLSELKLADGRKIKVSEYYRAAIKVENRDAAYTWLRNNGFGDLVKNQITCSFGRNEDEKASKLVSDLNERGYESAQREWVEPSTLRAFVREQYEAGREIPMELLGAYIGHKTTIKSE